MASEEILIINNAGNVLFYYTPEKMDSQSKQVIIASFLTAIQQFARAVEHGGCSLFNLSKRKIAIRSAQNLPISYVLLFDPDSKIARKPKKVDDVLDSIQSAFEKRYDEKTVCSWIGDAKVFADFKDIIERISKIKK
ncbi:MAG: hypothetical protein RBG13Loki_4376 [Promethearchaeota archaeon CR_4]|nr:MAG: hypothetical protein RBG13Loki_4376 [Candidatus Lokiarchaeota archaeon CR_4]